MGRRNKTPSAFSIGTGVLHFQDSSKHTTTFFALTSTERNRFTKQFPAWRMTAVPQRPRDKGDPAGRALRGQGGRAGRSEFSGHSEGGDKVNTEGSMLSVCLSAMFG
ncbi:hypothetical protein ACOMHN_046955 [Nucella lapillus]